MPKINQSFNGRNTYQRLAQYACLFIAFLIAGNSLSRAAEIGCDCDNQTPPTVLLALNNAAMGSAQQVPFNPTAGSKTRDVPVYLNSAMPIEQRIDDLLPRIDRKSGV